MESNLIKKAVNGDEIAFRLLVEKYKNYIFAIILKFIKDNKEAENVSQEVFLQIFLSLDKYKDDNFKAWIGRIATNKAIDYTRKKKTKDIEDSLEENILDGFHMNPSTTPESLVIEEERKREIRKAVKNLPDIYGQVIYKFYFQGKSYDEIALEEDVAKKTIASRLYRGKNLLKEEWRKDNESLWYCRMETF